MNVSRLTSKTRFAFAAGVLAFGTFLPAASADVILKTLNWNQGDLPNGTFNNQAIGIRFTVAVPTHISSVEGTFGIQTKFENNTLQYADGIDGNIWGAIINLDSSNNLPIMDFSSPTGTGIIASTVFNIPIIPYVNRADIAVPVDVTTPLSADLLPGTYGLVFAEGGAFNPALPNAHETILMSQNGTVGSGNYTGFYYQGGWGNSPNPGFVNRVVFGIQGTAGIPEPSHLLVAISSLALLRRRR